MTCRRAIDLGWARARSLRHAFWAALRLICRASDPRSTGRVACAGIMHAATGIRTVGAALKTYGETKYGYVRQVDAHSHWIGLRC